MKNMQMHNENYFICRIYGYQKFLIPKNCQIPKKTGYPDIKKRPDIRIPRKAGIRIPKKAGYPDTKKMPVSGYIKSPDILCNPRMDLALMDFQLKKPK